MHYHIFTLEELDQAWEAKNRISIRQNSEASVSTLEDLITWDSPTDTSNPKNWRSSSKWLNVLIVSLQATITTAASSVLATGVFEIKHDLRVHNIDIVGLPMALFVLGYGLGPLFLAPLSELFGRRIVYLISLATFTFLSVGCALAPNISVLIVFRLLAGIAGSASASLGAGSVGDMFEEKDRGRAQAIFAFGPTNGTVIGALVGGFIVDDTHHWEWLQGTIAIAAGVMTVVNILLLRETYGPFLLAQKTKRFQRAIGNEELMPKQKIDLRELFTVTLTRPIRLLLFAPICTLLSLYMGLIQGLLYLSMLTLPLLYGPKPKYGLFSYKWQGGNVGLSYLAAGLGIFLGIAFCMLFSNRIYRFMLDRDARQARVSDASDVYALVDNVISHKPEFRVPLMQLGMMIVPIGLLVFAWTAQGQMHGAVPLVGLVIYSFGMILAYVSIQTYIVDTFGDYAASAVAAGVVMRGVLGCVFSVVGLRLYMKLGYGVGTTLLACIMLLFSPVPAFLYVYGARIRGGYSEAERSYR